MLGEALLLAEADWVDASRGFDRAALLPSGAPIWSATRARYWATRAATAGCSGSRSDSTTRSSPV